MKKERLSPSQERFVEEYLVDLNASRAALAAGYSPRTAKALGAQLLKNLKVAAAIAAAKKARSIRTRITQDQVLTEIARLAFSDVRRYAAWGPEGVVLRASEELTDDEAAAVLEVSETKGANGGGSIKFKLHDKLGALRDLAKHLGMEPPDRLELSGPDGKPIQHQHRAVRELTDDELRAIAARGREGADPAP